MSQPMIAAQQTFTPPKTATRRTCIISAEETVDNRNGDDDADCGKKRHEAEGLRHRVGVEVRGGFRFSRECPDWKGEWDEQGCAARHE